MESESMHKAIVLDLGKVIVPFDFMLGYEALARFCPYEPTEIRRRIGQTGLVGPLEKGLVEPADFVSRLSRALDFEADYHSFCDAWAGIFHGQIIPDSMLCALAAHYRLLLLSNTNAIHFQIVRKNYPMLRYFHDLVLSFEVGAAKPEPAIFQAAIRRAGCRPEECFFADDMAENVEAARKQGMDAVQFKSLEGFERDLQARGIAWDLKKPGVL